MCADEANIINEPLLAREKIIIPPPHIKVVCQNHACKWGLLQLYL